MKLDPQFRVPALPVRTCPCPLSRVGIGWAGDKTEGEVVLVAMLVVVDVAVSEDVEREYECPEEPGGDGEKLRSISEPLSE